MIKHSKRENTNEVNFFDLTQGANNGPKPGRGGHRRLTPAQARSTGVIEREALHKS